jgi:16S rRNA (guanine966-N2)-methyltransferase
LRIIAGSLKGRMLIGPKSTEIRPTSDRLRETLFNVLSHRFVSNIENANVLDLFAGSGSLAFEALSRGAKFACLVDNGIEARGLLRANVESLGLGGTTRILKRDTCKLGNVSPFEAFSLVFMDPPYGKGLCEQALNSGYEGGWFAKNALFVLEDRATIEITLPDWFELIDKREAGEGRVWIGKMKQHIDLIVNL